MPSPSHGRRCLVLAFSAGLLFLILNLDYLSRLPLTFQILRQYSFDKSRSNGVGNDTLGFEKIFVINAPWQTDRKDSISLAASYSGISLNFVDGVDADNIHEKAFPPGDADRGLAKGLQGSWRAHMNALREVIQQDLATALILEDDADWDFRLRSQLAHISTAVDKVPQLVMQAKNRKAEQVPSSDDKLSAVDLAMRSSLPAASISSQARSELEPYGKNWDVLWLGHCGASLPPPSPHSPNRILIPKDQTIPEPQYLKPAADAPLDNVGSIYPPHTRIIHQANATLCTIAYAVTQAGARKLLYEFGIRGISKSYDSSLSEYCNGQTRPQREDGAPLPTCVTVQPPVFGHHSDVKSAESPRDISVAELEEKPYRESRYIKWSVRMNLERLVKGQEGIIEQWPDREGDV